MATPSGSALGRLLMGGKRECREIWRSLEGTPDEIWCEMGLAGIALAEVEVSRREMLDSCQKGPRFMELLLQMPVGVGTILLLMRRSIHASIRRRP